MTKFKLNKSDMKKYVFHPIGEKYMKALLKFYQTDFDNKSTGKAGFNTPRWAPLKRTTIKFKQRMKSKYVFEILKMSGRLRKNIKGKYFKRDTIIQIWVDKKVEYAQYLNDGTPNMRARPILAPIPDDFINEMKQEVVLKTNVIIDTMFKSMRSANIKVS